MIARRLPWAAALALAACAHVEAPPGGPEDEAPPRVIATRPESLAVEPSWRTPVVLVFDERVSERGLEAAVTVSPRTSPVVVDHRGDEVRVSLREGWRPGTIYQITVLPELRDLFANPLAEPIQFTFSTGPAIPDTRAAGEVYDRITGEPEVGVRVEAIRTADSLVYSSPTDSAGRFVIARIPEGDYLLRAYRDQNRSRALDPYEPRDSVPAALVAGDSVLVELGVLLPDSTPAVVVGALLRERTLELRFDDYLDPAQRLAPARVRITAPSGAFVPVLRVSVAAPEDARREPADSTAPLRARPAQSLLVELSEGATVQPEVEYRIRASDIRNVSGLVADADTTLAISGAEPPRGPAAPPDSAVADTVPADTIPADAIPADTAPAAGWAQPGEVRLAGTDFPILIRPRTRYSR